MYMGVTGAKNRLTGVVFPIPEINNLSKSFSYLLQLRLTFLELNSFPLIQQHGGMPSYHNDEVFCWKVGKIVDDARDA